MDAKELADKFIAKTGAAVAERNRQSGLANEHIQKRGDDIEHCKRAMESNVLPFLAELKQHLGEDQFTFAPQIDMNDHKPVGVSFRIGEREQRAYPRRSETFSSPAPVMVELRRELRMFIRPMRNRTSQIPVI